MNITLKQARLLKGLTQKEVASKLGVHGDAKKISEILEFSYDFIFFNANSTFSRINSGNSTS